MEVCINYKINYYWGRLFLGERLKILFRKVHPWVDYYPGYLIKSNEDGFIIILLIIVLCIFYWPEIQQTKS